MEEKVNRKIKRKEEEIQKKGGGGRSLRVGLRQDQAVS